MTIHGTLQNIETGALEVTQVECAEYQPGYDQMVRTVPEGMRLLSVIVDR